VSCAHVVVLIMLFSFTPPPPCVALMMCCRGVGAIQPQSSRVDVLAGKPWCLPAKQRLPWVVKRLAFCLGVSLQHPRHVDEKETDHGRGTAGSMPPETLESVVSSRGRRRDVSCCCKFLAKHCAQRRCVVVVHRVDPRMVAHACVCALVPSPCPGF